MTKKIKVDDEPGKNADGEEAQVKKKAKGEPAPPGEPEKEQDEDSFDSETRRPRMRW